MRLTEEGFKAAIDFITVFAASALGADKAAIAKLMAGLQKRFSRHA